MAIEDLGYANTARPTRHAPSRVRTMLKLLRAKLEQKNAGNQLYTLKDGSLSAGRDILPMIDLALAEWTKIDDLIRLENLQRDRIAQRLTAFVEFFVAIHLQVLQMNGKKRPKRTAAQKILIGAKIRETRRLRGTLGKRQKQKLKGNLHGLTVIVGEPSPRGRR